LEFWENFIISFY